MQHFISINQLNKNELENLLTSAARLLNKKGEMTSQISLSNKSVANLFFEASTRTRCSFDLAAKHLQMKVVNLDVAASSTSKGETIEDTVMTLQAMGIDVLVVRHPQDGLFEQWVPHLQSTHLINAGEGITGHPTQALLDMLTIQQANKSFADLRVAIVGDIAHSRVARSHIQALELLGCKDIRVIAPKEFLPSDIATWQVTSCENLAQGLEDVDVVTMLRIQHERILQSHLPNMDEYIKNYCLTEQQLHYAKPDAIILHPGPINRDVEITHAVADGKQSRILSQIRNGVVVRMAVLLHLLK